MRPCCFPTSNYICNPVLYLNGNPGDEGQCLFQTASESAMRSLGCAETAAYRPPPQKRGDTSPSEGFGGELLRNVCLGKCLKYNWTLLSPNEAAVTEQGTVTQGTLHTFLHHKPILTPQQPTSIHKARNTDVSQQPCQSRWMTPDD